MGASICIHNLPPPPLPAPRLSWPSHFCWCLLKNEILKVHFLSATLEILSEGFLKGKKSPRCSKTCHPYGGSADKKWNVPWRSAHRVHCTRLALFVLFLESMGFPSFVLFSLGQKIELYFAPVTEELLTVLLLWSSLLVGHVFIVVLVRHFSLPPWLNTIVLLSCVGAWLSLVLWYKEQKSEKSEKENSESPLWLEICRFCNAIFFYWCGSRGLRFEQYLMYVSVTRKSPRTLQKGAQKKCNRF